MGTAGSERQGKESKGTEWRMQIGGERLGRAGIAVAGMEKPVEATGMEGSGTVGIVEAWQAAKGAIRKGGTGGARTGMAGEERSGRAWTGRQGNAGEVRQGSEAKGNAGRVEVRQEWSGEFVVARSGLARQARCD